MTTISGALKGAENFMLLEVSFQLCNGKLELVFDESIDSDFVRCSIDMWDWSMVSIVGSVRSNETRVISRNG